MNYLKKCNFFVTMFLIMVFCASVGYAGNKPAFIILTGADARFSEVMLQQESGGIIKVNGVSGTASFTGEVAEITIYNLPPGGYDKIHTKVSQLNLHGRYNGLDFTYTSTANLNDIINLNYPAIIGEGGYLTLKVNVDVASIFMNGSTELDPTDPANSGIIDRNIKRAFKDAFSSK